MRLSFIELSFLFASSVAADFLSARSLDHGQNVELGELVDVHDFYTILEQSIFSLSQNGSFVWEDVTEYKTFDGLDRDSEFIGHSTLTESGLVAREDECRDLTGITWNICKRVPSRLWFWGTGGALIILYSPRVITRFLNLLVWRDGSAGANGLNPHDELKVRGNSIDYHISLPYLLDSQGKPEAGSLHCRSDPSEGVESSLTHDFVFSENDQGTNAAFSAAVPEGKVPGNETLEARGPKPTRDYTIMMSLVRRSSANTIAKPSCIARRFACCSIDNRGSWRATMHLMINCGQKNMGTFGTCCN
ncbi:hypothetical protein BJX63DRAFT_441303 [Aspergillus granulosus]|uniref:Uncharacterized protein n=1 Tax=Aspergillus granulosus TaxID=176169 RepID=A0ABR4HN77_9EURO